MINNLQKIGKVITKSDQKSLNGGMGSVPIAGDGPSGGGGSGGGGSHICVCLFFLGSTQVPVRVPCDSVCSDGSAPFCP